MAYGHPLPGDPFDATSTGPPSSVPDVPGIQADDQTSTLLRSHVGTLTGTFGNRFPGAQPVSFTRSSLDLLLREDFWVCEKSDGQRVLVLIVVPAGHLSQQQVFLIDRKNRYYWQPPDFFFPHSDPAFYTKPHHTPQQKAAVKERVAQAGLPYFNGWPGRKDTLLDGELVWDTEKATGRRKLRLLLFDALVVVKEDLQSVTTESKDAQDLGRLDIALFRHSVSEVFQGPSIEVYSSVEVVAGHLTGNSRLDVKASDRLESISIVVLSTITSTDSECKSIFQTVDTLELRPDETQAEQECRTIERPASGDVATSVRPQDQRSPYCWIRAPRSTTNQVSDQQREGLIPYGYMEDIVAELEEV